MVNLDELERKARLRVEDTEHGDVYMRLLSSDVLKLIRSTKCSYRILQDIPVDTLRYAGEVTVAPGLLLDLRKALDELSGNSGELNA